VLINHLGLYFKLHGCYRPTTMKKTIIKRRKRVVPALREQSPTAGTHSSTGSSASPETSPRAFGNPMDEPPRYYDSEFSKNMNASSRSHPQRPFPPIPTPVDFTGYHSIPMSLPHHPHSRPFETDSTGSSRHSPGSHVNRQSTSPHPTASGMVIIASQETLHGFFRSLI
jgi:GATA-binding protein